MKRVFFLVAIIFPFVLNAQTNLSPAVAEDFSTRAAFHYQQKNDSAMAFITEQMSRSGAGGLNIDKTMTELKNDPAALDAAMKYLYQFSDCNRQKLIANLRTMSLQTNNVFPAATYIVNKFKGESKALLEEKPTIVITRESTTVTRPAEATAAAAPAEQATQPTTEQAQPSQASAAGQPAPAPAATVTETINWDVRKIFSLRQPQQLIDMYGKENVVSRMATDKEGNERGQAYYVFPDTDNEMEVIFDGDNGNLITFTKQQSKWKSPFGIKVGDPLEKIVKINGRNFKINGFEWEKGGMVYSWDGGAMDGKGVSVVFKAINIGDTKAYDQVTGGKKVSSDHSALKKLGVVVEEVGFKSN